LGLIYFGAMAKSIQPENIKKILIVLLAGLGDLVMASAAIRQLRKKYSSVEIDLLILEQNEELGRNCPYVNEVFVVDRKLLCKSIFGNIKTFIKLRKKRYDIAVNLYNLFSFWGTIKMFVLFFMVRPGRALGRNTDGKGFFYDFQIKDSLDSKRHQVDYMLELVGVLGAEQDNKKLEVWYKRDRESTISDFLSSQGIRDDDIIIGIHPGGRRLFRRWPIDKFVTLSERISANYNAKIIITGNKEELKLAQKIKRRIGKSAIIVCGSLDLSELSALIKLCRIYITNDTGPMHIANVLGVPLIVLEGGGPEDTHPFINENLFLFRSEVACVPCNRKICKNMIKCLDIISPDSIMLEVENILSRDNILSDSSIPPKQKFMKLIIITEVLSPDSIGGAGKYVYSLSTGLVKRGHRITVITRQIHNLAKREERENIKIFRVSWENYFILIRPWAFLLSLQGILKEIRDAEPHDFIIFNQPFSAFCALLIKDTGFAKKIYNFHSSWVEELEVKLRIKEVKWYLPGSIIKKWLYKPILFLMSRIEGAVLRRVERIIVLSQFSKGRVIDLYNIPADKIEVIAAGIDADKFSPVPKKDDIRKRLNLAQGDFVLITVRNLVPRMGIENLILAFKEVVRKYPAAYLIIVGGGFLERQLKGLAKELNLTDRINFTGTLIENDLCSYYQLADLFILPTKYLEGFGFVTLEAMASGLPVLGTPVGGTIEILTKFDKNFIFAGSTPTLMAEKILEFMDSKPDLRQLAIRCREFVLREYSQEAWFDRIEGYLQKI